MTRIEQLSRLGHTTATRVLDAFNADQPRDENGRWGEGGTQASTSGQHGESSSEHQSLAREAYRLGRPAEAKAHQEAAFQHAVARNSPTSEHTARAQEASKVASDLSKKMHAEKAVSMTKPTETHESIIAQANAWRASRTSGAAAARLRSFKGKKMG